MLITSIGVFPQWCGITTFTSVEHLQSTLLTLPLCAVCVCRWSTPRSTCGTPPLSPPSPCCCSGATSTFSTGSVSSPWTAGSSSRSEVAGRCSAECSRGDVRVRSRVDADATSESVFVSRLALQLPQNNCYCVLRQWAESEVAVWIFPKSVWKSTLHFILWSFKKRLGLIECVFH